MITGEAVGAPLPPPPSYLLEAAEHRIIRDTHFGLLEIRNSLNVIDVFLMLKGCSLEKNCRNQRYNAHPVIPAQAGIQGFQSLAPCSSQGQALGPRFRGGDEVASRWHSSTYSQDRDTSCSAHPPDFRRPADGARPCPG
jgi:hypothetical protein